MKDILQGIIADTNLFQTSVHFCFNIGHHLAFVHHFPGDT